MTAAGSSLTSSQNNSQPQASSVRLKTVKRGYSTEADKLLDYLELGIFDALSKGYLKSFIFAVYLDPEDPNNVVECFTFNFTYHTIPGTEVAVPVLTSLNDHMERLSVSGEGRKQDAQSAIIQGKVPTLGEVKQSVKSLIRRFILLTQHMDHLPHRRFVTFKLFYVDGTPTDYEPPLFRAADVDKDKFFFATHDIHERPDKVSVGTIDTAFHGVSVEVSSISNIIPSAEDRLDEQPFGNLADISNHQPALSEMAKLALKDKETRAQKKDAVARCVIWDAEGDIAQSQESYRDAEGTPDPEHVGETPDLTKVLPVGIRDEDGAVVPLGPDEHDPAAMDVDPSTHAGTQINDADFNFVQMSGIETQMVGETQALSAERSLNPEFGANASFHPHANDPEMADASVLSHGIQTEELARRMASHATGGDPMLSGVSQIPETQQVDLSASDERNTGYAAPHHTQAHVAGPSSRRLRSSTLAERSVNIPIEPRSKTRTRTIENSDGIGQEECCCETNIDVQAADEDAINQWCQCEGKCGRWYHLWCMGYLSSGIFNEKHPEGDEQATKWVCFSCSFFGDQRVQLFNEKEKEEKLANLVNLALFRRTLKTATGAAGLPDGPMQLRTRMGCSSSTANVLWKRLEKEGFIAPIQVEVDSIGLLHNTTVETQKKGKGKQKVRKSAKRPKYGVVRSPAAESAFANYFDPSGKLEKELMGFEEIVKPAAPHSKRKRSQFEAIQETPPTITEEANAQSSHHPTAQQSQTQWQANSLPPLPLSANARARLTAEESHSRAWKKAKVSLAQQGVDVEV